MSPLTASDSAASAASADAGSGHTAAPVSAAAAELATLCEGMAAITESTSLPLRRRWPARIARGPVVGRLRRDPIGLFAELKAAQGDVAATRLGRATLFLVSHPDHIDDVLVGRQRDFPRLNVIAKRWRRGPRQAEPGATLGPGGDQELRLRFRRALQPGYARGTVDAYWPEFVETVERTTARWRPGEPIDLVPELERLTVDLAILAVFGRRLDIPLDELLARTRACLDLRVYASSGAYRARDALRLGRARRAAAAYDELSALLARHIDERRREGADGDDVLARIVRFGDAEGLPEDQLVLEALGQLFTLNDPVASAAAWAVVLLGSHPDALERLRNEADGLDRASAPDLPFTRAVLAETLRLRPPFTLLGRQSGRDLELAGRSVRAGDPVVICPALVHVDPRWWPRPDRFEPERWLDGSAARRPRLAYLPFGAGPRKCPGDHVAWRDLEAVVACLVTRWELVHCGPPSTGRLRPAAVTVRLEQRR